MARVGPLILRCSVDIINPSRVNVKQIVKHNPLWNNSELDRLYVREFLHPSH